MRVSAISYTIISAIALYSFPSTSKNIPRQPIRVAVIDTGIGENYAKHPSLCKDGHKDLTNTSIFDNYGHGTHIFGLIDQYVKNIILEQKDKPSVLEKKQANYCQVIIKFYDSPLSRVDTLATLKAGLRHAIDIGVDIINISAGGTNYDKEEYQLIKEALDKDILVIVASGNNGQFLTQSPKKTNEGKYFPAMYDDRIVVVGNGISESIRSPTSNYGPIVDQWEVGTEVQSLGFYSVIPMTGTSQSTAIFTGKFIRFVLSQK